MSDVPDDHTIRVRRSWPGHPPSAQDDDIDEITEVSRRRIASTTAEIALPASPAPELQHQEQIASETTVPHSGDADSDDEAPVRHRATYIHTADPVGQTDGSTIVARRESRRRATREAQAAGDVSDDTIVAARRGVTADRSATDPAPTGARPARGAAANEVYAVRHASHIIAEHLDVGTHPPQQPVDGAAEAARRRRAARRTTVIVVTAASVIVLAAAAALIAIVLTI